MDIATMDIARYIAIVLTLKMGGKLVGTMTSRLELFKPT